MEVSIFAYSDKGCILAKKVSKLFHSVECFAIEKFAIPHKITSVVSTKIKVGEVFTESRTLIFIGACGIASRSIAKHIKDKTTDPAIIVIDECGNFVIPILSGHIGGANEISNYIGGNIGAISVITTATDCNGKFSVDQWASKNKLVISDMKIAKEISATILKEDIALQTDFKIVTDLADGFVLKQESKIGIYITYTINLPFQTTLRLVPKVLVVGIGCKKGTESSAIQDALNQTLADYHIDRNAIKNFASIDLKKEEQGLLAVAKEYQIPIKFYTASQLEQVPGNFTPSNFVKTITGVDNVCERSACMEDGIEQLIVKKTVKNSVTIAIALEEMEVRF